VRHAFPRALLAVRQPNPLYTQAEKTYVKVLDTDPESSCATEGLQVSQQQRCFLARDVEDEEAKKSISSPR
jgi:hypothetical protein